MSKRTEVAKLISIDGSETPNGKPVFNVVTSRGAITCWDTTLAKDIQNALGQTVELQIYTSPKGYESISGVYATDKKESSPAVATQTSSGGRYDTNGARIGCAFNIAKDILIARGNLPSDDSQFALAIGKLAEHIVIAMKHVESQQK